MINSYFQHHMTKNIYSKFTENMNIVMSLYTNKLGNVY